MPELPEVETIVRDLRPHLVGRHLRQVELLRASVLRYPDPASFLFRTKGQRVRALRRRGKFIHVCLESGDRLVVHLGMSGSLTLSVPGEPRASHTHLVIELDDGAELRYRDPRRFGRLVLGSPGRLERLGALPRLGPEPLSRSFASSGFTETLRASGRVVKAVLLDQAVVAGCGNIYADEACFLARVRPTRRGHTLT
ncbi:MAG: DNA-formamidopyrimidine glycosylase family protein, partial [Candidatus Dormibacteria bacterium]